MSRFRRALCLAALGAAIAPASASATIDDLVLDSQDADAAVTDFKLLKQLNYVVTVKGAVSFVSQSLWNQPAGSYWVTCGTTDDITFPSTGLGPGAAGLDAEFVFAGVARQGCGNYNPPLAGTQFEVSNDGGDTFTNPTPIGVAPTAPHPQHTYSYIIKGTKAKAAFRLVDSNRADNNGALKIRVQLASNLACVLDGWKSFGIFSSSLDCKKTLDIIDF